MNLAPLFWPDASEIKRILYRLLNETTDPAVLALDKEFYAAADKQDFLAQFETYDSKYPSLKNLNVFEKWTHYCWIRMEISYLSNQKAVLNKIAYEQLERTHRNATVTRPKAFITPVEVKQEYEQDVFNNKDRGMRFKDFQRYITDHFVSNTKALPNSIDQAIQEDYLRGVPITRSIEILSRVTLQTVGTEHPTDPLSQEARDLITQLANVINIEEGYDADQVTSAIKEVFYKLHEVDAIPADRRDVSEEVHRSLNMTLDKLYDAIPLFIQHVFAAYEIYYGKELVDEHRNMIWQALERNLSATPALFENINWAGFDADGNENVTPQATRYAIRLHRIRIAEKHETTLATKIIKACEDVKMKAIKRLFALNAEFFDDLNNDLIRTAYHYHQRISALIATHDFASIEEEYRDLYNLIEAKETSKFLDKERMLGILEEQIRYATLLNSLAPLSSTYLKNTVMQKSVLEQFQEIFKNYKDAVRENTEAIKIKDEKGEPQDASNYVMTQYQKIMRDYEEVLIKFPELKETMRCFGIQLSCFKMTFGRAHIRQDASIFIKTWEEIFKDLQQTASFKQLPIFQLIQDKPYQSLSENIRIKLHRLLQNGSEQSKLLLQTIHRKYEEKIYQTNGFVYANRELERLDLALRHDDMFENIIISNAESSANIMEVESLLNVFSAKHTILIVPLLEKRQDLENFESILTEYIKHKIQKQLETAFEIEKEQLKTLLHIETKQDIHTLMEKTNRAGFAQLIAANPSLMSYLKTVTIEIMVGFSDTERVSGLAALISIQKVQEDFIKLAQDFGVTPKIFHGPGGDINRGGLKRRDRKMTLQGNARSNLLNTPASVDRYLQTQFFQCYRQLAYPNERMEFSNKPPHIQQWLKECEIQGTGFYEHLHDTEKGLGKLLGLMLGRGAHWMVTILNSSSRASQRGLLDSQGDRTACVQTNGHRPEIFINPDKPRAITATQMKEMLRDNIDIIIGPGYGLRMLGKERAERLYESSFTVRDMVEKLKLGIAMADYSIAAFALFGNNLTFRPTNAKERQAWAKECRDTYPDLLKSMNIEKILQSKDAEVKLMSMVAKLFAYIEEEYYQTKEFLASLTIDLQPDSQINWEKQVTEANDEALPLSILFSRLNYYVSNRANLDQIYFGLNDSPIKSSQLTRVGRLLGNVGAGMTAFRIMPPGFWECYLDYTHDRRPGVARAENEALAIDPNVTIGKKIRMGLFDGKREPVEVKKWCARKSFSPRLN